MLLPYKPRTKLVMRLELSCGGVGGFVLRLGESSSLGSVWKALFAPNADFTGFGGSLLTLVDTVWGVDHFLVAAPALPKGVPYESNLAQWVMSSREIAHYWRRN